MSVITILQPKGMFSLVDHLRNGNINKAFY